MIIFQFSNTVCLCLQCFDQCDAERATRRRPSTNNCSTMNWLGCWYNCWTTATMCTIRCWWLNKSWDGDRNPVTAVWHCSGEMDWCQHFGASPSKQWTTLRQTLTPSRMCIRCVFGAKNVWASKFLKKKQIFKFFFELVSVSDVYIFQAKKIKFLKNFKSMGPF